MSNRCENCIECYKTTEEQVEQLQAENERMKKELASWRLTAGSNDYSDIVQGKKGSE